MAKKKSRMGVVGTGGIARGSHIPGIQRSPDAELVALCDIVPEKLKSAAETYSIEDAYCFKNYRDLIKCPDVDAITICTPNDSHVPIALEAVAHNKPFAVEKPISTNARSAKKLADAVAAASLPSMICFSYRFRSSAMYAKDFVSSGKLGKLRHVYTRYTQAWANPENNTPLVWRFNEKMSGSGALGDLGSHMLDLVRFIIDEEYIDFTAMNGTFTRERSVINGKPGETGVVDVDDYSHFFATTSGGIATSFEISRNCTGRGNYQRIEIYGDKGAIVYEAEHEDSLSVCLEPDQLNRKRFDRIPIPVKYKADQMQTFFNMVKGRKSFPGATIADGYMNQVYLDAVKRSAKSGKIVRIQAQS